MSQRLEEIKNRRQLWYETGDRFFPINMSDIDYLILEAEKVPSLQLELKELNQKYENVRAQNRYGN